MFRINRRTDYAVRVILCLAKRPGRARLSTQTIQEEMQIPRPFLQRIIADLAKAGLVQTYAGPNGGLELSHPAESINLRNVWEAIEGPLLISDCLKGDRDCPFEGTCPVRRRWARIQGLIAGELEASTFDQLAQEALIRQNEVPLGSLVHEFFPSL